MGSIYTQMLSKALVAGAPPQTPNSEGERFWRLPVWHAELEMVLPLFKNGFYSHQNALRSVGGWGSAPDPPNSERERLRRVPVWHAEGRRQFPSSPRAPENLGTPLLDLSVLLSDN